MAEQSIQFPLASRQPWPAGPPPMLGYEFGPQPAAVFQIRMNETYYAESLDRWFSLRSNRSSWRPIATVVAFVVIYAVCFFSVRPLGLVESLLFPLLLTVLIVTPIALMSHFVLQPTKSSSLQLFRQLGIVEHELTYLIYGDGLAYRTPNSVFMGRWKCYRGAKRFPDGFLILIKAQHFVWLSTSFMTEGDANEVAQILESNLSHYETTA